MNGNDRNSNYSDFEVVVSISNLAREIERQSISVDSKKIAYVATQKVLGGDEDIGKWLYFSPESYDAHNYVAHPSELEDSPDISSNASIKDITPSSNIETPSSNIEIDEEVEEDADDLDSEDDDLDVDVDEEI
jgi:hypothetical protein